MIGLPPVRLVLPVTGALAFGVGVGSAIAWLAGGADPGVPRAGLPVATTITASVSASPAVLRQTSLNQDSEAVALLRRAAQVQTAMAWSGTQVITTWSAAGTTTRMVDLSHEPGEGTSARLRATTADQADLTYLPDADAATADDATVGPLALLTKSYALTKGSTQLVAGRAAHEVVASRPDGTVAARFWLDDASGLLLRRELVDPHGWVTHSTVFVDVVPWKADEVNAGDQMTRPWTTEVTHAQLDAMRSAGWICPDSLPGGLTLYDIRRTSSTTDPVIHLAYSDGLVNVSVFEERGHLDPAALDDYTREKIGGRTVHVRRGTSAELTWQAAGTVYTILADAPETTVAAAVTSLPAPGHSGGWSRVRRGLDRMGSWVNPRS